MKNVMNSLSFEKLSMVRSIICILKPSLQKLSTLVVMSHLHSEQYLILQSSVGSLSVELNGMYTLCCHNSVCLSGSLESKFLLNLSGSLDAMFEKSLNTSVNVTSPEIKYCHTLNSRKALVHPKTMM